MIHSNVNIIQNFMEHIKRTDSENFVKSMLFCFGAPTIKGLKAGCLINFRRDSLNEDLRKIWKKNADKWLRPLGLNWVLLNDKKGFKNALVLIYDRELLERALCCDEACEILANEGYPLKDVEGCLKCLKRKFCEGCPHEVGLFLSYTPYDVKCFMKNEKCENHLECGYWKVYGNVKKARRTFRKYKRAEYDAARMILQGQIK